MEYPICEAYPAVYRGVHGAEQTVLRNNGRELRINVRGVEFIGTAPTAFEPAENTLPEALAPFTLNIGYKFAHLCNCEITYDVPLPVFVGGVLRTDSEAGILHVAVVLGVPDKRHGLDVETLRLDFTLDGQTYAGTGWGECFETELLDIQKALPDGVLINACINCAYSDYSPYGSGVFGSMLCFRDNKAAYLQVKDKNDMLRLEGTFTESVQESYRCPEFAPRVPGTGYRG